jgi:protein-S-isoprenylcysteine O-methyltransferase Ste14
MSNLEANIIFLATCFIWIAFEIWLMIRDRRINALGTQNGGRLSYTFPILTVVVCFAAFISGLDSVPVDPGIRLLFATLIIWAGVLLRCWAIRSLGKYFRTVLTIQKDQNVIKNGPYKYIRHSSYLGTMIICVGIGFGCGSWFGLVTTLVIPFIGFYLRMNAEERVLSDSFGFEYIHYMKKTFRLVPFVY